MGIYCYSIDRKDPLTEKMSKLKNDIEKKNLIGTGGSSKVKFKILITKNIFSFIGLENN